MSAKFSIITKPSTITKQPFKFLYFICLHWSSTSVAVFTISIYNRMGPRAIKDYEYFHEHLRSFHNLETQIVLQIVCEKESFRKQCHCDSLLSILAVFALKQLSIHICMSTGFLRSM